MSDGKLRESRQLHSWMGNAAEESALDLLNGFWVAREGTQMKRAISFQLEL